MRDVHPLRPELARERLRQAAEREFRAAEREPPAAAHTRGRTRKDHRAVARAQTKPPNVALAPRVLEIFRRRSKGPSPDEALALCSNTLIFPSSARTRATADFTSFGRLTFATTPIAFPPAAEISPA